MRQWRPTILVLVASTGLLTMTYLLHSFHQPILGHILSLEPPRKVSWLDKFTWTNLKPGDLNPDSMLLVSDVTPGHFLSRTKNPCWMSQSLKMKESSVAKHLQLRCIPYFFLGGFPKCGTTDMFIKLHRHPNITKPTTKEPHWWTRKRLKYGSGVHKTFDEYCNMFKDTASMVYTQSNELSEFCPIITYDSSASTAWDNHFWHLDSLNQGLSEPKVLTLHYIHDVLPKAKFIMLVRDPVDRLLSDYMYFNDDPSLEEFHDGVKEAVHSFFQCLQNHTVRRCVYDKSRYSLRFYIGIYSVYVSDFLQIFPRNQLLVIRTEEVDENHDEIMQRIASFLDIGPFNDVTLKKIRSKPHANSNPKHNTPMWTNTSRILRKFYAPFNAKLAEILNDSAFNWND